MIDAKKILIGVGALVLMVIIGFAVARKPAPSSQHRSSSSPSPPSSITREEVPSSVPEVPEPGAQHVPPEVAVPTVAVSAHPESKAKLRVFTIEARNNVFSPGSILVNKGDTVSMRITAADKNYDIVQPDYGYEKRIPEGKTEIIEFGATAEGRFTFLCRSCAKTQPSELGYITILNP